MTAAIQAENLVKIYSKSAKSAEKKALEGLSLTIPKGSMFALLGPNGAGKSTFINILAGLARKTSGRVVIDGLDIDADRIESKRRVGIVPQEINIDPFFTPREALEMHAGLYGVPEKKRRTDEILAALGLSDKANAYARSLSGGMRRRLMVAKALVHTPPILILDEPTAGVDVELRQQLWAYVRELNRGGTTVVLTTHYLEEAEELCDTVAIINKGALVALDSVPNLLAKVQHKTLVVQLTEPIAALPEVLLAEGFTLDAKGLKASLSYDPAVKPMDGILRVLSSAALPFRDMSIAAPSLEDVFLAVTKS
ncbi:MAG: ABC transporter ATP-binding protein [Alphaproteobacteria bacterium]|jgi:ABC-2 type transport system ATP-binding protein|nr:ABC transporter ATP-binding protein [Alphaproteobacteria bacterium]